MKKCCETAAGRAHAEGILQICELYLASPPACVAGVTGGDLKRRIEAIMSNLAPHRLNYAKKAILAVAAIAAVVTPIVVAITNALAVRLKPPLLLHPVNLPLPARGQKGRNGGASSSPVTFNLPYMPVRFLINLAYIVSSFQRDAVGLKLRTTRRAQLSQMRTLRAYAGKRFVIHAVQADWSRATTAAAVSP